MKIDDLTYEDFHSSLRNNNTLDTHYNGIGGIKSRGTENVPTSVFNVPSKSCTNPLNSFKQECKQNNLITLMDLLEYYNKLDVKPFLEALLVQREAFYEFNIDIFKDFFTVSSIAKNMLARFPEKYYEYITPIT